MKKTERRSITRGLMVGILILAMMLSTPIVALAAGFTPGTTVYCCAETKLNLRATPQGEIVGQIKRGEQLTIMSNVDRNGYYQVRVNSTGENGFAYGQYLTTEKVEPIKQPTREERATASRYLEGEILYVASAERLRLRTKASTDDSSKLIRWLETDEAVVVLNTKVTNGFLYVQTVSDQLKGYAYAGQLSTTKVNDEQNSDVTWPIGTIAYANVEKRLLYREGPAKSYNSCGYILRNDEVRILNDYVENNYIYVEIVKNGNRGYVDTRYLVKKYNLKFDDEWQVNAIAYSNEEDLLPIRETPYEESKIISHIPPNGIVWILSTVKVNGYVLVRSFDTGYTGYAYSDSLVLVEDLCECPSNIGLTAGTVLYVTNEGKLNLREEPKKGGKLIVQLKPGTEVQLLSGERNNGYLYVYVTQTGQRGYVDANYLTFVQPE